LIQDFPFLEVCSDASGGNLKVPKRDYTETGAIPIIDQGKQRIGGYTNDRTFIFRSADLPVVIFGDHTCCVKHASEPFAMGADGVKILKPKPGIDSKYLYHFLQQIQLTDGGYDRHFKYLKRIQIPIPFKNGKPDLAEQKRIAAILDKADGIRRKRREALHLADDFLRSCFLDIFGDPVSNPKQLPTSPLSTFGEVITGNTPPRKDPLNYGSDLEWIKSDNINTPSHFLTSAREYLSNKGESLSRTVSAGSILVTCIAGSKDCIGNCAITDRKVSFNQQINAIVPNEETNYLFLYVQFLVAKKLIQLASTQSMKGMVSKSAFSAVHFLKPHIDEQAKYAEIVSKIFEKSKLQSLMSKASNDLFVSLQQRAFKGEL
jgi:type I restriction enzyme S subunit